MINDYLRKNSKLFKGVYFQRNNGGKFPSLFLVYFLFIILSFLVRKIPIDEKIVEVLSFFFTEAALIIIIIMLVKQVEKRDLEYIGLDVKKKAILKYILGFFIGIAVFVLVLFGQLALGAAEITQGNLSLNIMPTFIFLIFAWMVQGAAEEIIVRGYLLPRFETKWGAVKAILVTSIIFSALHLGNSGLSALALINLFLFGLFAALYAMYAGDIWGICAFHSAWNFTQGNLLGYLVSGGEIRVGSMFITETNNKTFINGGAFGPEGGIIVTLVLVIGIIILAYLIKRKVSKNIDGKNNNINMY